MPELHIDRPHRLGLDGARQVAQRWILEAETEWSLRCRAEPGQAQDRVFFERSGVSGCLTVSADRFALQLKLGFLLGAYSRQIEQKIRANLDELLGPM
jgi:putative polyhydroxyalkanoate system protein